jgi:hypothetical protein
MSLIWWTFGLHNGQKRLSKFLSRVIICQHLITARVRHLVVLGKCWWLLMFCCKSDYFKWTWGGVGWWGNYCAWPHVLCSELPKIDSHSCCVVLCSVDVKLSQSLSGRMQLRASENKMQKRICLYLRERKWLWAWENYIMISFTICALFTMFGWLYLKSEMNGEYSMHGKK